MAPRGKTQSRNSATRSHVEVTRIESLGRIYVKLGRTAATRDSLPRRTKDAGRVSPAKVYNASGWTVTGSYPCTICGKRFSLREYGTRGNARSAALLCTAGPMRATLSESVRRPRPTTGDKVLREQQRATAEANAANAERAAVSIRRTAQRAAARARRAARRAAAPQNAPPAFYALSV